MDGAVIFFFVIAAALVAFTILALVSVSRAETSTDDTKVGAVGRFQQKLIDINKVPDPKGRGTIWTPSE